MARHIEQPGSRHSKPAASRILSRPSFSACCLIKPEPGTTKACLMAAETFLPLTTSAAARISSMREFVQEPIKTTSTGTSEMALPAVSPI